VSPPVLINPHEHRHINTAHPTDIRVTIFGTSGFNVNQIIPQTVTLGGAHPVFAFTRHVNRDQFLDETFVFRGTDVKLPRGIIEATVTGSLKNGQTFATATQVFNRNFSFYPTPRAQRAEEKALARPDRLEFPVATLARKLNTIGGVKEVPITSSVSQAPVTVAVKNPNDLGGPVIAIKRREPVVAGQRPGPRLEPRLHASVNRFLRHADLRTARRAGRASSAVGGAT
jgi:hypothetical protein